MELYHITQKRLVPGIMRRGLLFPASLVDRRDLKEWLLTYARNMYIQGKGGTLTVLKVRVPRSWVTLAGGTGYIGEEFIAQEGEEYVTRRTIPKERISVFSHRRLSSFQDIGRERFDLKDVRWGRRRGDRTFGSFALGELGRRLTKEQQDKAV